MRVVAMALWHRDPARNGIESHDAAGPPHPPQAGQNSRVWVPAYEAAQETALHLLWCPPFSEENGWDARPAEIVSSQIVTARVRAVLPSGRSTRRPPGSNELACEVAVQKRVAFVDCMRSAMASVPETRPGLWASWEHVGWCGQADIGGFTYLSAVAGEAQLELILTRHKDMLTARYEHYLLAGWSEATLGAWPLQDARRDVIEALLVRAELLTGPLPAADSQRA